MTEIEARQKFVSVAAAYVGYTDNTKFCNIYNDFIAKNTKKISGLPRATKMDKSYAWCACFASSVGIECGWAMDFIPVEISCRSMITMWAAIDRWVENDSYTPQPGDYIYFDWEGTSSGDSKGVSTADHVGLVEYVEGGIIHTIEGNSNNSVRRNVYAVGNKNICGFGCPDYAAIAGKEPAPVPPTPAPIKTLPTVRNGMRGSNAVKALQSLLNELNDAGLDVDGGFGSRTEKACREWQNKEGLVVDGVCGPKTWASLFKI